MSVPHSRKPKTRTVERTSSTGAAYEQKVKARGNGEASIYERTDRKVRTDGTVYVVTRWCAAIPRPDGTRKTLYGKTRQDVADKLTDALGAIKKGLPLPGSRLTVGAFLDDWLRDTVQPRKRHNTYLGYEVNVRLHIKPAIGSASLAKLTPQDVQRMLTTIEQGRRKTKAGEKAPAPRTAQYAHAVLRIALNQALRWGLVGRNVAALVTPPTASHDAVRVLSQAEAVRLLEALRGNDLEALYVVAMGLGLRRGEVLGLAWYDPSQPERGGVDLEHGAVHVRKQLQRTRDGKPELVPLKTANARRTVMLPRFVAEALRDHQDRQGFARKKATELKMWQEHGLVFTTGLGTPLDAGNVTRYFERALKKAELPRIRFHDLRHACASLLLAQGVELWAVSKTLGHSGIQITNDTYGHLLPGMREHVADRMDALVSAAV